ncbi:MAG: hypothetical protein MZV63_26950 [Marinilabiliales bacterium]|nr:hypothetical protein [Marinilabiliales bacterium]
MSPQAWEVVRNARSNMIKIINSEVREKCQRHATGHGIQPDSCFEPIMELEKEPTQGCDRLS